MNVMLASSFDILTKDRKLRNRDEIRSKNWWKNGDARWSDRRFKKRLSVNRETFHLSAKSKGYLECMGMGEILKRKTTTINKFTIF